MCTCGVWRNFCRGMRLRGGEGRLWALAIREDVGRQNSGKCFVAHGEKILKRRGRGGPQRTRRNALSRALSQRKGRKENRRVETRTDKCHRIVSQILDS